MANPDLAGVIRKEILDAGIPFDLVELEVTDWVVMSDQALPEPRTANRVHLGVHSPKWRFPWSEEVSVSAPVR